jgi:hypothetical protein
MLEGLASHSAMPLALWAGNLTAMGFRRLMSGSSLLCCISLCCISRGTQHHTDFVDALPSVVEQAHFLTHPSTASVFLTAASTMSSPSTSALAKWAAMAGRGFASAAAGAPARKVAVLGAAGGIGQPLSLLLKVRGASEARRCAAMVDVLSCDVNFACSPRLCTLAAEPYDHQSVAVRYCWHTRRCGGCQPLQHQSPSQGPKA